MYIYVLYIPMLSNAQICHINEIRSKASGSGEAFSPPGRGQRTEPAGVAGGSCGMLEFSSGNLVMRIVIVCHS